MFSAFFALTQRYVRIAPWFDIALGQAGVDWQSWVREFRLREFGFREFSQREFSLREFSQREFGLREFSQRGAGLVFRGGVLCSARDGEW